MTDGDEKDFPSIAQIKMSRRFSRIGYTLITNLMPSDEYPKPPSDNKSISIHGDVRDSNVIIGDNNTVNQTIIQKFFNIFKSDAETLEHRNRRILLGHVENAWIKGVLDASLHGAALLDLGIKQDPEAVTKYPWAIKKESTDETLPAGLSILEIFDSIGMGRSLLILGAPGSGKTTTLLELARGLIARAREDITQPIPMVFNLASWTEKLTLADWLAQELNNLYSVPRKTAPDWVNGNKLLLLLDGLDEVRQESRTKCVEAINVFRKEHGLTSLAVCSRSQDYADLNAKLSFEGAIEVQPLTQKQITEFFNRFGKEMAGIKQVLKKDGSVREMAETPLFLSIMIMAYRDKQDVEILVSGDEQVRRNHLFDTYIERMLERPSSKITPVRKQKILHWLSYLASKMVKHNQVPYLIEDMQPTWFNEEKRIRQYELVVNLFIAAFFGLAAGLIGLISGLTMYATSIYDRLRFGLMFGLWFGFWGIILWLMIWLLMKFKVKSPTFDFVEKEKFRKISTVDTVRWNWNNARRGFIEGLKNGLSKISSLIWKLEILASLVLLVLFVRRLGIFNGVRFFLIIELGVILFRGLAMGLSGMLRGGIGVQQENQTVRPEQRLILTAKNFVLITLIFGMIFGAIVSLITWVMGHQLWFLAGLPIGLLFGLEWGGIAFIQHYILRFTLSRNNILPWRLVPFLDHCVDLIFLRRVGGGYIFIHRLLMEHFAEIYVESSTSKEN